MNKLSSKPVLSLAAAKAIAAAAEAEAEKNNWPMAIAVADDSGGLIYFVKMDNCKNAPVEIAKRKAAHAANYRRATGVDAKRLEGGNNAVLSLPGSMPIEGGIPIIFKDAVIGAIGVSGMQPEEDGRIAQKGVEAFEKWIEG